MTATAGRRLASVAAGSMLLLTGCGTGSAAPIVTVTDLTTIAGPVSAAVTVPASPTSSSSAPPSPVTVGPTAEPTSRSAPATRRAAVTVVQAAADPDVPGPDHGPACKADPQYSDEAPTGLRADVVAAWIVVKAKAKAAGVTLCLNDGKRSRAQQQKTYDDYVVKYGKATADELVLTPDKSAHVAGYAVDVQPANSYTWLQASAGRYGFCRIYDNEAWHFEYAKAYVQQGCPARKPKPDR